MRRIEMCLSLMTVINMVVGTQADCDAQSTGESSTVERNTDTNQIAVIQYPPLSQREGNGLLLPPPPQGHPRLFLNARYLSELRRKSQEPLLKTCWEKILRSAAKKTDGYLPLTGQPSNNDADVRDAIETNALLFVLMDNQPAGQQAVNSVLHYYETLKIDFAKPDVTRELGRAILTGSLVYDWCYPLLSAQQKNILIGRMETLAAKMEIEWPQLKGSSVTGHTGEAQLSRDMLALGVATYTEKPVIYNRVAGRIFAEFIPTRRFFYPAGYHHQGSAYGAYRFTWDLYTTFIFDRMGYPDVYGKNAQNVPYYFIYSRRPDGQLLRDGDDYTEKYLPFGTWWKLGETTHFLAGSYYKNSIVLNEAFKERRLGETNDFLFDFLFFDPTVSTATTKTALPLTRYFGHPWGAMIARTGWEDGLQSSDVIASMKVQEYNFSNHQHLDAGSFQIYYKGPLAVQSGIYQGKQGGYGSDHFKNYSQRSIAHNTLLVYDSTETFTWHGQPIRNDGGQRFTNDGYESVNLTELLTKGYKTAEILAHAFGPDSVKPEFSYLKGELAKAYSTKVNSFQRSFVFLNLNNPSYPAALLVFDRVSASRKEFKKQWLLHCVEEPHIDGTHTIVSRTEKGYSGQLINTTLLPGKDDLVIDKTGGPGQEYSVFGKNFPQAMIDPANTSADSAVWRISISPKSSAIDNTFLNVMQVMDNDIKPEPNRLPEKVETGPFVGAKLHDRIVLFSKTGELINKRFSLLIKAEGLVNVLITDVKRGSWTVKNVDDSTRPQAIVKNTEQVLYFKVRKGNYLITPTE